jgi:O-acetyl-ADP-ribose deacetylase
MKRKPFEITAVMGDITGLDVDAIVNAANSTLLGGGGVDGAIHRAAGPGLLKECRSFPGEPVRCRTGDVKVTGGYDLKAKYVIHAVGPVWRGGTHGEPEFLRSCYTKALIAANDLGLKTIAFPAISTGVYGYPIENALSTALDAIISFSDENTSLEKVVLVFFSKKNYDLCLEALKNLDF